MRQEIVIFHSALGLRPAVRDWAQRLMMLGHRVHTPDLFDGATFDTVEAGVEERDRITELELIERAQQAVSGIPAEVVYIGFSMGVGPAEMFAGLRPGARGGVFIHGAYDPTYLALTRWPEVPVALHYAPDDPWGEPAGTEALKRMLAASDVPYQAFTYPGRGHLFEDSGLPDHHAVDAEVMFLRVADFIDKL